MELVSGILVLDCLRPEEDPPILSILILTFLLSWQPMRAPARRPGNHGAGQAATRLGLLGPVLFISLTVMHMTSHHA